MLKIPSEKIWITSDTHYSHKNLVRSLTSWRDSEGNIPEDSTRDFDSVESMNEAILKGINDNVKSNDWLIHLGDFTLGPKNTILEFRKKIKCKNIILILGNHDKHFSEDLIQEYVSLGHFKAIKHYAEIKINDMGNFVVLCHYPIISWNKMRHGSIHCHGHEHSKDFDRFGEGMRMDIGIDGHPEFRPYHLLEAVALMKDTQLMEKTNKIPDRRKQ